MSKFLRIMERWQKDEPSALENLKNLLFFMQNPGLLDIKKFPANIDKELLYGVTPFLSRGGRRLISLETGQLLYRLAKECKEDTLVEIGSFTGFSTVCIGLGLKARGKGKLYAIDPQLLGERKTLRKNIKEAGVEKFVEVIEDYSYNAARGWNKKIGLLFVDGDHSHAGAKKDMDDWLPHLAKGGWAVIHDFSLKFPSVCRAAKECLLDSGKFTEIMRTAQAAVTSNSTEALAARKR